VTSSGPDAGDAYRKQFDWSITRRILRRVIPFRRAAVLALVLSLIIAATGQSFPYLQRLAIDRYLVPTAGAALTGAAIDARLAGVGAIAALYVLAALVEFAGRYGFQYAMVWLGQNVLYDLRADVFAKLQRLPVAYFDRNPVGRLITRVTSDVDAINQFITSGLVTVAQSLFVLTAVVGYMFWLDARLALAACAAVPVIFAATRYFRARFRDAYRAIRLKQAVVNATLNENITGMSTVQLFHREARNRADFDGVNREFLAANLDSVKWFSLFYPSITLASTAALAVVLWYGGTRVLHAALTVGTLFAFTQYVRNFFQPLQDLSDVLNTLQAAMASAERIFGVLDEPETVADASDARAPSPFRGAVELRDVWFSYAPPEREPREDEWVLRGVDLRVGVGETVALVGATGAGKTSVISLISRFYDVQRGAVCVDGVDVRAWPQRALRRRVGVVLQDVFLFAGTIESNLRLNDPDVPFARIEAACREVGVHDFITSLPGGYQAEVRERGATLSTGQKQLLAFARVLIHSPAGMLVLDEATASVDTDAEERIQRAQRLLMQGRTCIVIAHRLSTIQHADRIVVMRKGRVVEQGRHAELMEQGGYYASLYRLQYAEAAAAPTNAA
jgi:ATP-binding cassette subfamily B protein